MGNCRGVLSSWWVRSRRWGGLIYRFCRCRGCRGRNLCVLRPLYYRLWRFACKELFVIVVPAVIDYCIIARINELLYNRVIVWGAKVFLYFQCFKGCYLPMQNLENMLFRICWEEMSPVISPRMAMVCRMSWAMSSPEMLEVRD